MGSSSANGARVVNVSKPRVASFVVTPLVVAGAMIKEIFVHPTRKSIIIVSPGEATGKTEKRGRDRVRA